MGKRLVKSEKSIRDTMTLPRGNDVLGIVNKVLGQKRMMVACQDGFKRMCRIRGKMRRRHWVRRDDVVLISPWDFQSENRGDILFRYTQNQVRWLRKQNILKIE